MIEVVRDRMLSAIVCCDIDPESKNAFDRVDRELLTLDNGTESSPWKTVRPDDKDYIPDKSAPGPCQDKPGRWHYVVTC